MSYDSYLGLHVGDRAARDAAIRQRARLLTGLGLAGLEQDDEFDEFAAEVAARFAAEFGEVAESLYAMVNLISTEQVFAGLHNPPGKPPVGRTMSRDHGFCPEVADRGRALVLSDVLAAPRFASNHVVDAIGIRTYAGAPLVDQHSGVVFGTVCVIGDHRMPDETEHASLALIKERGASLMRLIEQRTALPRPGRSGEEHTSSNPPSGRDPTLDSDTTRIRGD
ncbi:GAF domain-containing protein [Actinomadura sp. KC216]|uniref:GAF domain-containing protein n=1 Tax=Actinomadura sp. KC216 TaxID=2530370 RepID=UPI00104E4DCD|nr:GAF domain-containing protein [Actinomadura sp. KC216]TDB88844.1 GAF domain-containing protein [Actinomadura sp. KC216]